MGEIASSLVPHHIEADGRVSTTLAAKLGAIPSKQPATGNRQRSTFKQGG